MLKHVFFAFSLLALTVGAAQAASNTPEQALRSTVEQLQTLIEKNHKQYKAHPETFYKIVNKIVVPRFDVPYIGQLVLARYWRQATAAQRKAFQDAFKNMLIRSYANALLDNANSTKVIWEPTRNDPNAKRATVRTVLQKDTGPKYPIDFAVHKVDGQWKIYDITVNGISLVLNFRSQITSDVKRSGLDTVIKRMQSGQVAVRRPTH